ncbi:MAG: FAD-binding oxidoreductase [Flavobacteriales bacterium]|nr:FAD-binding oxidoreductase [Flavobacteriales bacterium]
MASDPAEPSHLSAPLPYLIVGGGVAGICLALHLQEYGVPVRVADLPHQNVSSRKAAGLVNPFIIKRYALSWKGVEAYAYAHEFYVKLEKLTSKKILETPAVYRLFPNSQILSEWEKIRASRPDLQMFMGVPENAFILGKTIHRAAVPCVFRVRTKDFFASAAQILNDCLREEYISPSLLVPMPCGWRYKSDLFKGVIFCQGPALKDNPFFNGSFLRPCKGQWLRCVNPGLQEAYLSGIFLIPEEPSILWVGSTYEFSFADPYPDEAGRMRLSREFERMTGRRPEVVEAQAGIRATTKDRRPVLGSHPSYPGLFIFNGLGSRGFLLAPYLAQKISRHILFGERLPAEVSFGRL